LLSTVSDGVLYIGGTDQCIYAIDAPDQPDQLDVYVSGGLLRSTPAVAEGKVFYGGVDGCIYALDAATGTNLWKCRSPGGRYTTIGEFLVAPTVVDHVVYVGGFDAAVYALDAATGQRKWRQLLNGGDTMIYSSPVVWHNLVISGTSIPPLLCALDAATGRQKWQVTLPQEPYSSPVLVDDVAYFGCGAVSPHRWSIPTARPGYFIAVNLTKGKEIWRFPTGGQVYSSPAVVDGTIYFGCWMVVFTRLGELPGALKTWLLYSPRMKTMATARMTPKSPEQLN
jgi:outer membrane protein assembly factor BamB